MLLVMPVSLRCVPEVTAAAGQNQGVAQILVRNRVSVQNQVLVQSLVSAQNRVSVQSQVSAHNRGLALPMGAVPRVWGQPTGAGLSMVAVQPMGVAHNHRRHMSRAPHNRSHSYRKGPHIRTLTCQRKPPALQLRNMGRGRWKRTRRARGFRQWRARLQSDVRFCS